MSFWGNLGRGALKVGKIAAPIALGMTGVGLPAAMAVSGGLGALDKKAAGGSWKDAARAGVTGAAEAGIAGGASKAGGGFLSKLGGKLGIGGGTQAARTVGIAPSQNIYQKILGGLGGPEGIANSIGGAMQQRQQAPPMQGRPMPQQGIGPSQAMMRGQLNSSGYDPYATSPNLGGALEAGRNIAMQNQPWRRPPINPDPTQQLPNIYPQYNGY
jgi:hypothetical protein